MKEIIEAEELIAVAASWAKATMKVQEAWENGDHVLGAEHFAGVTFTLGS